MEVPCGVGAQGLILVGSTIAVLFWNNSNELVTTTLHGTHSLTFSRTTSGIKVQNATNNAITAFW